MQEVKSRVFIVEKTLGVYRGDFYVIIKVRQHLSLYLQRRNSMLQTEKQYNIYIVISQTGTILSRILKFVTGAKYNHVSISLANDLNILYSFGRKQAYNPFWAGFVKESPQYGTFRRFSNTEAIVVAIPVKEKTYMKMKKFLERMYIERDSYHYNYLGLVLAAFRVNYKPKNHYYCSDFVRDVLLRFQITEDCQFSSIVQPIHFLELFDEEVIYTGKLKDYRI